MNPVLPPTDEELHALYRDSDAARAEPSPVLDRAILDAAREAAVARRPQSVRRRVRPWWQVWLAPVSVAAVAVVGLTLSVHIAEDPDFEARTASRESRPLAAPAAPAAAPLASSAATSASVSAAAETPLATHPAAGAGGLGRSGDSVAEPARPAEATKRRDEAAPARMPMKKEASADAGATRPEPAAFPPPPTPSAPPAASALADRATPLPKATAAPLREERQSEADRPAAAESMQRLRKDNAAEGVGSRESLGAAAKSAAPSPAPPPARAEREAKTTAQHAEPERWLAEILRLRASGQAAEAARELDRFRQRYPDYPLPRELANPTGR